MMRSHFSTTTLADSEYAARCMQVMIVELGHGGNKLIMDRIQIDVAAIRDRVQQPDRHTEKAESALRRGCLVRSARTT